ncbi:MULTISPECIES: hypothetical protein [unclassified Microcoleus]|uniref:hypothetical protein n=1 Tax=unclassified Microcoleus TaxID=2642155 RepID=UPI002FD79E7A
MARCKVYGNNPNEGPKMLKAQTVEEDINAQYPSWKVTHNWTEESTVYSSDIPTYQQLEEALQSHFSGFNFMED